MNTERPVFDNKMLDTRRNFFGKTATGIGGAALSTLLDRDLIGAEEKDGDIP